LSAHSADGPARSVSQLQRVPLYAIKPTHSHSLLDNLTRGLWHSAD